MKLNIVNKIIAYENGEMDETEVIEFFTDLITSGAIYHLQGSYQRMAHDLVRAGLIEGVSIK